MRRMSLHVSQILFALTVAVTGASEAAEQGTTTGIVAFNATGEVKNYGAGTMVWSGTFVGVSMTDSQKGPLHNSNWDCTGEVVIQEGIVHLSDGFCTVSDGDGDSINLYWQRTDAPAPPDEPKTKGTYLSGTGKYEGIQGYYTFACRQSGSICTVTSGEYAIP